MDQIGTDTEPCSRSGTLSHRRNVGIKNTKRGSRDQSQYRNLFNVQRLFGDSKARNGDHQTFHDVFNHLFQDFTEIYIHYNIINRKKYINNLSFKI